MSCCIRIQRVGETATVVKEARGPEAAGRLRAEGERLVAAAHPGVVRVVSSHGDDERWELQTAHGGRPLDIGPPLPVERLAAVTAAVATTLADLHEIGIAHGCLRAEHILIGAAGRPLLCGFGADADRGVNADPADDVAALGQIVHELLAGEQPAEPIPERRWSRRRRWSGWARATLLTLADQACAEPSSRRPSARRLAASISDAFDVDVSQRRQAPAERPAPGGGPPPELDPVEALRHTVAGAPAAHRALPPRRMALGVAAVLVGAMVIARSLAGPEPARGDAASRQELPLDTPASSVAQPTPQPEAPGEHGPRSSRPPRCSGSGCSATGAIQVEGSLVTTARGRFQVGRPSDIVAIGDWDCDGLATPAALRPETGEVFIFPRWADGDDLAVRAVRTIPGATSLEPARADGGCTALQARLADGRLVAVTDAGP